MSPLLRRRDEPGGTRYQMREKLFAIGDDFWVETDAGERAFKVDGKALRVRSTFILEDPSGEELFKIQEKKVRVRDTMEIEHDGDTVATIKKALVTPLRDRFSIELKDGSDLSAKGNIVDHEYEIERDGNKIAEISNAGSGSATHTGSKSHQGRTTHSSLRPSSASTRWPAADDAQATSPKLVMRPREWK